MHCFWPQRTIACLRWHACLPTCAGSLLAGSPLRCAACPLTQYGTRHRILTRVSAGSECWRSHESLQGSIARLRHLRLGRCPRGHQLPARQQRHLHSSHRVTHGLCCATSLHESMLTSSAAALSSCWPRLLSHTFSAARLPSRTSSAACSDTCSISQSRTLASSASASLPSARTPSSPDIFLLLWLWLWQGRRKGHSVVRRAGLLRERALRACDGTSRYSPKRHKDKSISKVTQRNAGFRGYSPCRNKNTRDCPCSPPCFSASSCCIGSYSVVITFTKYGTPTWVCLSEMYDDI